MKGTFAILTILLIVLGGLVYAFADPQILGGIFGPAAPTLMHETTFTSTPTATNAPSSTETLTPTATPTSTFTSSNTPPPLPTQKPKVNDDGGGSDGGGGGSCDPVYGCDDGGNH